MSETPDVETHETGPSSLAPRPKRSPLTIIAIIVAALLVLGGGTFAAIMIIGQKQQLNDLTELVADRTDAPATASASASSAADIAARANAASTLTESIASGETAYTDSAGHTSDESLRTALRTALDAGAAALADPDSSAEDLQAAQAAIDSAADSVVAAHVAAWSDINGAWCSEVQGCTTITGLTSSSGSLYVQDGTADSNGCLWGYAGTSGEPHNARVTYCPAGSPLVDAGCSMPEDVTRDRLYRRQDCAVPFYRS
jgi:hypothetical protein